MTAVKHLILDVGVIIDLWLEERSAAATEALFRVASGGGVKLWIASSSLATLDYAARSALRRRGMTPEGIQVAVPALVTDLLHDVSVLTTHGFDQVDTYLYASDFEDAQIAACVRSLRGQPVCIVTEANAFDALGEVACKSPGLALDWLNRPEASRESSSAVPFVDLATQQASLRPRIERNIEQVLRHGQYILGPEVRELEARLQAYTGAKHCITVASGTEALLISLMALGIGPGDEVITTPFTFVATVEVIVLIGAKPVFVDIDAGTCNIDAALIEAKITERTKAIMPVSLYGQPADMDAINAIAARHGDMPVIEDAAQSFGATFKGKKSCNLSTVGCTSFFPSKPLGCYGDGGAIFTSDDALANACREIRVHGQSDRYLHTRVGVGGRMDTIQCAVVLAKLERFEQELSQRQEVARRYHCLLATDADPVDPRSGTSASADKPIALLPWPDDQRTSVFAQYTILVQDREAQQAKLKADGIPTAVHYPMPMNQQPAYAHLCCPDCTPQAQAIAQRVMSLPMHADLTQAQQRRIVDALHTSTPSR